MNKDLARFVAFDTRAPQNERDSALAELQQQAIPTSHLSMETIGQILEFADMNKSIPQNVVPFPGIHQGKPGVQSVKLDDRQLGMHGEYWEKPASMNFDALRAMVDQTPILNAVIMTRIRQVQRFCRVQEGSTGLGFGVKHIDKDHQSTQSELESIKALNRFFQNCGWEFNPRERKKLRRDSFSTLMGKAVRDSLVMDSCAIETEMKRDRKRGIDGIAAIDGATIRLVPEGGYKGDEDIFALQVVLGAVKTAYTFDNLIYEPRNPRSDIIVGGYGLGEAELLVRVVTGFLNAMTHNITGFDNNAIPKGVLHLSGDYTQEDLVAFRRYWNSMVKGVNSQWSVPVLVSKDQESKASFEKFGVDYDEMHFAKWMTFLTSIICAIYGMSPSEINSDSFSGGNSSPLNGSDTAEKLADSKDKGLRPLLSYFENLFTDFITCDFSDKYVFRWAGLDEEDAKVKEERAGKILTVNEMRAEEGYDKMDGPLGDAPLNPSLVGPWQALMQQEQPKDFGGQAQPGGEESQSKDVPEGFGGKDGGEDFGRAQAPDGDENDELMQKSNSNHDDLGRFASVISVAKKRISSVIGKFKAKDFSGKAVSIMSVGESIANAAKVAGLDIAGYSHALDVSAIQHTINHHGDEAKEKARGQLPITEGDLLEIPNVVSSPEAVRIGDKNGIGRGCISYVKHLPDGSVMLIEEIRSGRKQLALQTMWKYPGTRDADALLRDSELYGQTVTEDAPIIIHFGSPDKLLTKSSDKDGIMDFAKSVEAIKSEIVCEQKDFGVRESVIYRLGDL